MPIKKKKNRKLILSKEKEKKKPINKKAILIIIATILAAVFITIFVISFLNNRQSSTFKGIPDLTPGKNGVAEKSADLDKYGTEVYTAELTDEEIEELHESGLNDEDISIMTPFELYRRLYGSERAIREVYMDRYKSPYTSAKEPSDSARDRVYEAMLSQYEDSDYKSTVQVFLNSLKNYTYESYEDEPITSLYHDALSKIPEEALEDVSSDDTDEDPEETADTVSNSRDTVEKSLDERHSAIATLYDTFDLNVLITTSTISSNSCMPQVPLETVEDLEIYDLYDEDPELEHLDYVSPLADLLYVYDCVDEDGNNLTVYIESIGINKDVAGIFYEDSDVCIYKAAFTD